MDTKKASKDLSTDYQPVSMDQVCFIYYILIFGLISAGIIYLIESIFNYYYHLYVYKNMIC